MGFCHSSNETVIPCELAVVISASIPLHNIVVFALKTVTTPPKKSSEANKLRAMLPVLNCRSIKLHFHYVCDI